MNTTDELKKAEEFYNWLLDENPRIREIEDKFIKALRRQSIETLERVEKIISDCGVLSAPPADDYEKGCDDNAKLILRRTAKLKGELSK